MWNPLKRKKKEESIVSKEGEKSPQKVDLANIPGMPDPKNMNFMERMAFKQFQKMTPEQQEKALQKALDPKNVAKNKDKILAMIEGMEKSGQIDKHQAFQIKKQLGLL